MTDSRLRDVLEAWYAASANGIVPDLTDLCGGDEALVRRAESLLQRECALWSKAPPAPTLGAPRLPTTIGDFTLLEPLGSGGMSRVYRARQGTLGREVALKVLREELTATEVGRLRFQREASITSSLDHPNIVPVYAAGEEDGRCYLAMKLLRGRSLDRCDLPMAPRQVATVGVAIARALQAAHDLGVVHRDIKPANIVIEKDVAYVVDFGLSSFTHGAGLLTQANSTPGTLIYLAPEVARRGGSVLDPRVDVYGLGATLYEAIAGRPPFAADNPLRVVHAILHHDPAPLRLSGRDRDLETIVLRAMQKQPGQRFQTAGEMADELQRYFDGLPIRSRPIHVVERLRRWVVRRPALSALIAVCLVLVGLLGANWSWQREERVLRLARALAGIDAAIGAGDVTAAKSELAAATDEFGALPQFADRRPRIDREVLLQSLCMLLQAPVVHADPAILAPLVRELEAVAPAPEDHRAHAALAIASRLLDANPVSHRPLPSTTIAAWPRAAMAIGTWAMGGDPELALRPLGGRPAAPLDHLFAALAMRLADCTPQACERELRLANAAGAEQDALDYSIAISMQAQGRGQEAYDQMVRLTASPAYAVVVRAKAAQLAAKLGHHALARQHLATPKPAVYAPSLDLYLALFELETLHELGDVEKFWSRWRELESACGHLPHYWLRGGYTAADRAAQAQDARAAAEARGYFERGLRCNPDPRRRFALDLALVELDWLTSDGPSTFEPLPDEDTAGRAQLRALADRAVQLGERSRTSWTVRSGRAAALVVAAQASRAAGDRDRGWWLLEQACRENDDPEALARFAFQVGYRVLQVELIGAEADADQTGRPLAAAAALGAERARRVIARIGSQAVSQTAALEAKQGLFLCVLYLREAGPALRAAIGLQEVDDAQEPVIELARKVIEEGGLSLTAARRPELGPALLMSIEDALDTLEAAWRGGQLTSAQVLATLQRWQAASIVGDAIAADAAQGPRLQARMAALQQALATAANGR